MKRNLFILPALALSATATLSLTSCRDYDIMDENVAKEVATVREYDENFVARYGVPAANHTWGLEKISIAFSNSTTRATDANVNVNKNQWCQRQDGHYTNNGYELINSMQVPGWPNFDGLYYASTGAGALQATLNEEQMFSNNSWQPVGDITEYEIQYVSNWFRTNQNPQPDELHLSDFFIQNVSCDNDQLQYLNQPGYNGKNAEYAKDGLANVKYTTNSNERLNYSLDWLHFKAIGGSETIGGDGWTHVNNFNCGNTNFNPEESDKNLFREIKYVYSSGTEDFACRSSMNNLYPEWNNKWVLKHLTWEEKGIQRDGWYLAFDFQAKTPNTTIDYDGYYSNWIIKITPAHLAPSSATRRIMCEDLGSTYDFDFNDVVFDVAYDNNNGGETIINLQAAGGTLPIWVGIDPSTHLHAAQYEAHKMLGHNSSTPVNVDKGASHDVAIYRCAIKNIISDNQVDITKIPIYVEYEKGKYTELVVNIPTLTEQEYNSPYKGADKTPRRFGVPVGVDWMQECCFIERGYKHFKSWVTTGEEDVNDGTGLKKWYQLTWATQEIHIGPKPNAGVNTGGSELTWVDLQVPSNASDLVFQGKDAAVRFLQIKDYNTTVPGDSPIREELETGGKKQVTFTVVIESATTNLNVLMVPVYASANSDPVYITKDGSATSITSSLLSTAGSYASAIKQDFAPNTFMFKRTFSKDDLKVDGVFCDYIMLYIEGKDSSDIGMITHWYCNY